MKTYFAFDFIPPRRLLTGVVTLLGVTLLSAAATFFPRTGDVAQPEMPTSPIRTVLGQWHGSFQSAIDRSFRGVVVLEITEQQHGQVGGYIRADVFEPTLRCKGTISARNQVQLVIKHGGDILTAEGEINGDVMSLRYSAVLSVGPDDGTLTLARRSRSESSNGQ